jgi:hypothetical protein
VHRKYASKKRNRFNALILMRGGTAIVEWLNSREIVLGWTL